jgi:hypothetical protein
MYDRLVVMDAGVAAECDEPLKLWNTQGGILKLADYTAVDNYDVGPGACNPVHLVSGHYVTNWISSLEE